MKTLPRQQLLSSIFLLPCLLALLFAVSCGRKEPAAPALSTAEAPAAMQQAFATASGDLAAQAQAVAAAAQAKDPLAVPVLLELVARPELTPQERAAANGCLQGLLEEARQQAAQGNAAAQTVLETYRASK